jgi:hypothetical protein
LRLERLGFHPADQWQIGGGFFSRARFGDKRCSGETQTETYQGDEPRAAHDGRLDTFRPRQLG